MYTSPKEITKPIAEGKSKFLPFSRVLVQNECYSATGG